MGHLEHNLRELRKLAGDSTLNLAVLKANAYGHDASLIRPIIEPLVDWLGVASVPEAVDLRKQGASKPILVFAPVLAHTIGFYREFRLTAAVGSIAELMLIPPETDFHLEFDTGMGRLGFYPSDWPQIRQTMESRGIRPSGIMTHFATSDLPGSDKANAQIATFNTLLSAIQPEAGTIVHASNSGGLLNYPGAKYDLVRHGITTYGYPPEGRLDFLKPVLEWKSRVIASKPLKKGMSVSYNASWSAPSDGYLAVIPVGYADGLSRLLSNKIRMGVSGETVRQVGNISMDYTMLFSEKSLETGSEVILLGKGAMFADEWAAITGTITYEMLCAIHPKIRRELIR